jgi:hypothetical protein
MSLARVSRIDAHTPYFMKKRALVAAIALALGAASAAQALPVIPGATGYGTDTVAGRGGTVYKVTNLNADGAGSLKACIDGTTARVCVFEVSGTIRLTQDLIVRNSKMTIAGQTAPSPGIMIRGGALRIQASDLLIQHIRVRVGDDVVGPAPDNRDSLKLEGSDTKWVKNVVIDHCSFSWAIDEVASIWGPHDNITFSNDIFSEGLNDSFHPAKDGSGGTEPHGYGVLLGSSPSGGRVTMERNILAHNVERNPLARARQLVFVNNLVYDRAHMDYDGQTDHDRTTMSSVAGNVFLRGPSFDRNTKPIYLRTNPRDIDVMAAGSKVYVKDNYAPESGSTTADQVALTGGDVLAGLLSTTTAPVWNSGLSSVKLASSEVYNSVLLNAGARPSDRDTVDKRIISHVKNRDGGTINCVAANGTSRCNHNAGGWPYMAPHTRRLTLPSNPNTVASNGYTNLENWLHSMSASVQGGTSSSSPTSPASLSVK